MTSFIFQLMTRNLILFWFGNVCLLGAIICLYFIQTSTVQVNNVNAFIKPFKFFSSVAIFCYTIGWLFYELHNPNQILYYSIAVVVVMSYELFVITWQAANGRLSHFNTSNNTYSILFTIMGVAISLLVIYTLVIGLQFFKLNKNNLPIGYLWGIRLGIILFVIFSFEGGIMGAQLKHSVGALDGTEGITLLNWSKHYGDLRVAHFFGIHALQILPLAGYYIFKKPDAILLFSVAYFIAVSYTLWQALRGLPFIK
jgi:hypothetical protein